MNEVIDVLLVEDNEADILLVQEAFKDARVTNQMHVVRDGQAALDFLRSQNGLNPDRLRPGLILLDLYMPKLNGLEVLQAIKSDDSLMTIPTVIMTSSQEEKDITAAYATRANSYVIKPVDFEQLITVINSIEEFWLSVVKLPRQ